MSTLSDESQPDVAHRSVRPTAAGPPRSGLGVAHLVAEWARRTPDAPAVSEPGSATALTYGELWEQAGRLAHDLAGHGVRRGDLVAVELPRGRECVIALLGVLRAGAAYLPLDLHAPDERLRAILAESGARALVSSRVAGDGPPGLPLTPASGHPAVPVRADELPGDAPLPGDDETMYVIYTSGSSGLPKGVAVPHRGVVRLVVTPTYCDVRAGDRVAATCNPAFDGAVWEIWIALTSGATLVPLPAVTSTSLDSWVRVLHRERIDAMLLTTSLFHGIAAERPRAFAGLHTLLVGGEQLDLHAARRVMAEEPPGRLVNCYGPTEGSVIATAFECTTASLSTADRVPIGRPIQRTVVSLRDEDLAPVDPGSVGELCIEGAAVGAGYVGRPELTSEKFTRDPVSCRRLYRTGDLARMRADGDLELIGRRDRQVKLRGFRIELPEIERHTTASGLVDAAFVEKVGEGAAATLVGFVRHRTDLDGVALRAALGAHLATVMPGYMIPSRWVVLDDVPLTSTGKVDRAVLLAMDATTPVSGPVASTAASPAGPAEDSLLAGVSTILAHALQVPLPALTVGFLELGGNSISAMTVAMQIREQLSRAVDASDVLAAETIADLVDHVRAAPAP